MVLIWECLLTLGSHRLVPADICMIECGNGSMDARIGLCLGQEKKCFLKSVVQAIPTYVMSCFQILVSTCDEMRKSISNHWWGTENGRKKMHWKSWQWFSTPKALGGLGF